MLKQLRHTIIKNLLVKFHNETPQLKHIEDKLRAQGINHLLLDHFALIDLPGPNTGISHLSQIFSSIGYIVQGRDYLPDKQNDFLWLAESDSKQTPVREVLPQVVVADFRLEEMPLEIKKIIEKYSAQAQPSPVPIVHKLSGQAYLDDFHAARKLNEIILQYLNGRDWPPPTKDEFCTVYEFNQLLAWVLLFGRRPNHFTIAVHLLDYFKSLQNFLTFIGDDVGLALNQDGGTIKGNRNMGVEQASTVGNKLCVKLPGGDVIVLSEFVEFIWRFPRIESELAPIMWEDYHVGFVPQNANRVIESLYE